MAAESTPTIVATEALVLIAKETLGTEYPTLQQFLKLSADLVSHATAPTEEGKVQQICVALHELLGECKALLPEAEWAALDVAIDSVIPVSLKLAMGPSVLPVKPADVNIEMVESVAVGCFRGLLRACIARVVSSTKSTAPAPVHPTT
jgi:hypothetical protein